MGQKNVKVVIPGFDLALTAGSGQCFRFDPRGRGAYRLAAFGRVLDIRDEGEGCFSFSCGPSEFDSLWHAYFDLETDYGTFFSSLPADGSYLHRAVSHAGGLRILRQEPFETLISFIISQRKSIPAIRDCVSRLSRRFGAQIDEGVYAFPSPDALAAAEAEALAACGLGYRVRYVRDTARLVASGAVDLRKLQGLSDEKLRASLLRLPGVGEKVADCVMLFGNHRLDAFPIDVWIDRVLVSEYPNGFPASRFPGWAGVLQQCLFCYARHLAGKQAAPL